MTGAKEVARKLHPGRIKDAAETMMQTLLLSSEEVMRMATALYEEKIRAQVETDENIGKMVIIDIETGDFAVDTLGFDSADALRAKNSFARLFGIRIGYNVAASFGGLMERTVCG